MTGPSPGPIGARTRATMLLQLIREMHQSALRSRCRVTAAGGPRIRQEEENPECVYV